MGIHYHDASVSKIMKEFGVNGVADLPLLQRIEAQEFLLDKFMEAIKAAPRPAVCDRTPLDMIGYMLGEVTMHNTPPEYQERIDAYARRCILETEKNFYMVLAVRPLPHYEIDGKSPPPNIAYQTLVQFIIEGACTNAEYLHSGVLTSSDLNERIETACEAFGERMKDIIDEATLMTRH